MKTDQLITAITTLIREWQPNTCLADLPVRKPVAGLIHEADHILVEAAYTENAIPGNQTYKGQITITLNLYGPSIEQNQEGTTPGYDGMSADLRHILERIITPATLNPRLDTGILLLVSETGDYEPAAEQDGYSRKIIYDIIIQH